MFVKCWAQCLLVQYMNFWKVLPFLFLFFFFFYWGPRWGKRWGTNEDRIQVVLWVRCEEAKVYVQIPASESARRQGRLTQARGRVRGQFWRQDKIWHLLGNCEEFLFPGQWVWKVMIWNSSCTLRAVKGFQAGRRTSSDCQSRRAAPQRGERARRQRDKQGGRSGDGCSRPGRVAARNRGVLWEWNDMDGSDTDLWRVEMTGWEVHRWGRWRRWRGPALDQRSVCGWSGHLLCKRTLVDLQFFVSINNSEYSYKKLFSFLKLFADTNF